MYAAYGELARGAQRSEIASYVTEYYDPECEYQPVEERDAIRGHDAFIHWNERWLAAWSHYRDEIDEIIDAGEVVVAAVRVHGRGRKSGMEISQRLFHVIELRGGKISYMREYLDAKQAFEAAGLSE